MGTIQPFYSYEQKGLSAYSVLVIALGGILAGFSFFSHDPIFVVIGVALVVLLCSGIYAFIRGETWSMSIKDGVLTWHYPRWPKSSGSISLSTVLSIVINDCSSSLVIKCAGGEAQKVRLVGHASRLRDYMATYYPQIAVEYVDGT